MGLLQKGAANRLGVDPGTLAKWGMDHATLASATNLYMSETDALARVLEKKGAFAETSPSPRAVPLAS